MDRVELVILAAVAGLAVGSFLNVVIDRLPSGRSIVRGASHCEVCGHRLARLDLVPVLSYLFLGGRCRYCGARIPRRIPLAELANGALYAAAVLRFGLAPEALIAMGFFSVLLVIFVIDLERQLILNKVTYPSAVVAAALAPWAPPGQGRGLSDAYINAGLGLALGAGVLLAVYIIANRIVKRRHIELDTSEGTAEIEEEALGFGDVKLGALIGLMLGIRATFMALDIAFIAGGLVALILLGARIRRRGDLLPFGPFLAGAAIVGLLWGGEIFFWYLGLFG